MAEAVLISMALACNIDIYLYCCSLNNRIGRGQFGDMWIATRHIKDLGESRYHEVAVKMLSPFKDDQLLSFKSRFDEVFSKCRGLESVCMLHGISVQNGRVWSFFSFFIGSEKAG